MIKKLVILTKQPETICIDNLNVHLSNRFETFFQLISCPFNDNQTSLLLQGIVLALFLKLVDLVFLTPIILNFLAEVRTKFIIKHLMNEDSLNQSFKHVNKMNLLYWVLVNPDFQI